MTLSLLLGWGVAEAQTITTVAGDGTSGFAGDGVPATAASLSDPYGVAVDATGNLFIADTGNHRIRRVDPLGNITTVAGNGTATNSSSGIAVGDGGPATGASLFGPESVAVDAAGNLFIADTLHSRIRRVDAVTGTITTVAGTGTASFGGDGGPATAAPISGARGVALDLQGNLFIAENQNNRVRRVDAGTGIITTVAGNGAWGFAGDGGPATAATLAEPNDVAVDAAGNLFIADLMNHVIRRVDAGTGIITTFAGHGGGLNSPSGVAVDAAGNLFIANSSNHQVWRVDPQGATVTFVAGIFGFYGFTGDGGPATCARLGDPLDAAVDAAGNVFIADRGNQRIRRVGAAPAGAGPDQSVDEGALVQLDGCGIQLDVCGGGAGRTYSWTQVAGPSVTFSNPSACDPTFTSPFVAAGGAVLTLQLTLTDGPNSYSDTVDVTVKNINHAPVTDAGDDQTVDEETNVALDGSNTFDPDGDPLTYAWAQIGGANVTLSDPSAARPTFVAPVLASGTEVFTFELTGSDGTASSTDEIQITVENVNHPPTAAAGPDASGATGVLVTLDGSSSSDPDGDGLTYLWTKIQGPAVTLTGETAAVASFSPFEPGRYIFRLTVTDPSGLTGQDEVTIVVLRLNHPPACEAARPTVPYLWPPNHKMVAGGIGGVTNSNGDAATITIVAVRQDEHVNGLGDGDTSPDAVIQGSTVLLRAERSGTGNGRYYRIEFRAADGNGASCMGTVKVFVPHDMKKPITAVDEGPVYDSTQP